MYFKSLRFENKAVLLRHLIKFVAVSRKFVKKIIKNGDFEPMFLKFFMKFKTRLKLGFLGENSVTEAEAEFEILTEAEAEFKLGLKILTEAEYSVKP